MTLRSSPAIRPRAEEFFGPYADRMAAAMSQYTPEQLQQFEDFIGHLCETMDSLLTNAYQEGRPGARPSPGNT